MHNAPAKYQQPITRPHGVKKKEKKIDAHLQAQYPTFPYDLTRHVLCKYCKSIVSWRSPTNAERQKKLQTEAN
jgi:phage gp36-like protein